MYLSAALSVQAQHMHMEQLHVKLRSWGRRVQSVTQLKV
jgi:hypothetical protein